MHGGILDILRYSLYSIRHVLVFLDMTVSRAIWEQEREGRVTWFLSVLHSVIDRTWKEGERERERHRCKGNLSRSKKHTFVISSLLTSRVSWPSPLSLCCVLRFYQRNGTSWFLGVFLGCSFLLFYLFSRYSCTSFKLLFALVSLTFFLYLSVRVFFPLFSSLLVLCTPLEKWSRPCVAVALAVCCFRPSFCHFCHRAISSSIHTPSKMLFSYCSPLWYGFLHCRATNYRQGAGRGWLTSYKREIIP